MSAPQLTKNRFRSGVWEGELRYHGDTAPELVASLNGEPVEGLDVKPDTARSGVAVVRLTVPVAALSDGLQTVVIGDAQGQALIRFVIAADGEEHENLRSEVALLRAELDLLKSAFRRHVRDVSQG